jgi:hypothetical protein
MKIKSILSVVIVTAMTVFFIASCNKAPQTKVEYYRNLLFSETNFDTEKGSHPLTPEQAKDINSYKFTYDETGRLVSIEFVRNDSLLGYSNMDGAAKVVYTYENGKQIKRFYDKSNKQIAVNGNVFTYEFTLDSTGMRTGLKFFDSTGTAVESRNKIHSYVWAKLPDGMVKENRYNLANQETIMSEFCPFYELRFSYNDKGFVTRMANYQGDSLYNCTAENCGDIGVSYFFFENSDAGDQISFSVHNTSGRLSNLYWGWAKRVNTVDENGYVTETKVFDQDDEPVGGSLIPVTRNTYDEHGALIKTEHFDKDGNIIENGNGVAYTQFKYDEKGERTETLDFNRNNEPVAPKQAAI